MPLTKPSIATKQAVLAITIALALLHGPVNLAIGSETTPCLQNQGNESVKKEGRYAPPFTIHLSESRAFFLSGLILEQPNDPVLQERTRELFLSFLDTHEFRLHLNKKARADRYGRRPAFLSRPKNALSGDIKMSLLQESLVAKGLARVDPNGLASQCARHLLDIEREARRAKAGLWSDPNYRILKAGTLELDEIVSTYQIIHGQVLRVSRNPTRTSYLNFGRNWKTDFTISLSKKNLATWETENNSLDDLANVPIYVRGWIEDRGGPLIRVTHPQQLVRDFDPERLEEAASAR